MVDIFIADFKTGFEEWKNQVLSIDSNIWDDDNKPTPTKEHPEFLEMVWNALAEEEEGLLVSSISKIEPRMVSVLGINLGYEVFEEKEVMLHVTLMDEEDLSENLELFEGYELKINDLRRGGITND